MAGIGRNAVSFATAADEVLLVEIARRCLRPELPGGLFEALSRAVALWRRISDALKTPVATSGMIPSSW